MKYLFGPLVMILGCLAGAAFATDLGCLRRSGLVLAVDTNVPDPKYLWATLISPQNGEIERELIALFADKSIKRICLEGTVLGPNQYLVWNASPATEGAR